MSVDAYFLTERIGHRVEAGLSSVCVEFPTGAASLNPLVVGDDVGARYAYPSVRHLTSGIRVVPRKESVPLCKGAFFMP